MIIPTKSETYRNFCQIIIFLNGGRRMQDMSSNVSEWLEATVIIIHDCGAHVLTWPFCACVHVSLSVCVRRASPLFFLNSHSFIYSAAVCVWHPIINSN